MTEHVSSDVLTPEEKHLRKMVEAVNQAAPRNLPADAVICPCENEHRPVYPVRYAYSNLYGEKILRQLSHPILMYCSIQIRAGKPGVFQPGYYATGGSIFLKKDSLIHDRTNKVNCLFFSIF
ncbi:hypothetical protein UA45_17950 [Morganella morganii]|uniref:Uncharacterized protein n=1 Tax=Morganella morganii TaxID=582 RepID=A0A0D8L3S1_MORMO|nr:hypothetical protein UA45_17950 [Morganella morganii]